MEIKRSYWETDGEQINNEDLNDILYKNDSVNEFLEYTNKHFIIATKGIGKTILLKSKRYLLESHFEDLTKKNNSTKKVYLFHQITHILIIHTLLDPLERMLSSI